MSTYRLSIVRGEQPGVDGIELDNPHDVHDDWEPVYLSGLPEEAQRWVADHGPLFDEFDDAWVLVTRAGEAVDAFGVLAVYGQDEA